ncbi:hypothetical protein GGF31_000125 [Allomyces arbusculus]|nr:hypothetical protein GGF31_000125 [Allomyces arbusculus]
MSGPTALAIPPRASTADRIRAAAPTSATLPTTQLSTSAGSVGAGNSVGSSLLGASWSAASPTAGSFAAAMAAVAAHRRTSTGPILSPTRPGPVGSVPGVHFSTDALTRTAAGAVANEPAPVVGFQAPAQLVADTVDAATEESGRSNDTPRGRTKSLGSATMPTARAGPGKGKVTGGKAEHEYFMSQVSFSGGKFWA